MPYDPFDSETEFPSFSPTVIPKDLDAVRTILGGQRAVGRLYALARAEAAGDTRFLAELLLRDWEHRFVDVLERANQLLGGAGNGDTVEVSLKPPEATIQEIASAHAKETPIELARLCSAFAARALYCKDLVPWKTETQPVYEHFRDCVEAEDRHQAVLDLFSELLGADRDEEA